MRNVWHGKTVVWQTWWWARGNWLDAVTWTGDMSLVDMWDWCGTLRNNVPLQSAQSRKGVWCFGWWVCWLMLVGGWGAIGAHPWRWVILGDMQSQVDLDIDRDRFVNGSAVWSAVGASFGSGSAVGSSASIVVGSAVEAAVGAYHKAVINVVGAAVDKD